MLADVHYSLATPFVRNTSGMSSTTSAPNPGGKGVRGPYRTGIRRRHEILDTAVQVFGQYGYAGSSLRRIAEDVGVSTPALIRHFGSKEGLFVAMLERSDAANDPSGTHDVTGLAYFRHFARVIETNVHHRGMVELLLTTATEASNPEHPARDFMVERYRALADRMRQELRVARERGEVRAMTDAQIDTEARGFIATMDGIELQWLLDPDLELVATYRYHFEAAIARWTEGRATS